MRLVDELKDQYGLVTDENGYAESIISTQEKCYCCGNTEVVRHELQYGTADRKLSKALGLWVWICPDCHRKAHHVKFMIDDFHKLAQYECDRIYGDGTFCKVFRRNYL